MLGFPKVLNSGTLPADNYFLTCGDPSNTNALGLTTNRLHFVPIRIPTYCRVIELGINLGIAGTVGQKLVIGIYDFDLQTGNPVNLLVQAVGEIALDGATGYKSLSLSTDLDPGIYYIAMNTSTAALPGRCKGIAALSNPILPMLTAIQTALTSHKYSTLTYDSILPVIAPAITAGSTSLSITNPILKVRTQ